MADEEKNVDEALKQEIWKYSGKAVAYTSVFICGAILGYLLWGDACGRCDSVKSLTAEVSAARSKTETVEAQWGQKYRALEREKEGLERQLKGGA